jgi:copper chaperone CopZ
MKKINQGVKCVSSWILLVVVFTFPVITHAQVKKSDTLIIKSSVVCGMCKERVENGLAFEKGIKDVVVDLDTKTITVKFNPKSTDPATIRKKVTLLGYDADDQLADEKAYAKLPACCKKDAAKH